MIERIRATIPDENGGGEMIFDRNHCVAQYSVERISPTMCVLHATRGGCCGGGERSEAPFNPNAEGSLEAAYNILHQWAGEAH